MPLVSPESKEDRQTFISRCMGNSKMNSEFPNNPQRFAVCNNIWEKKLTAKLSQELKNMSK